MAPPRLLRLMRPHLATRMTTHSGRRSECESEATAENVTGSSSI